MARRLVDGVWILDLGFVSPLRSNAYLVDDGLVTIGNTAGAGTERADDAITLVDTGLYRNWPTLRRELDDAGYGPADLDRVLLTHYDPDHVGGLGRLLPEFEGPVCIGAPDHALANGTTSPPPLHHKGLFHRVARRLLPLPADLDVRPVEDEYRIGRFTAYVTPGHNPGHVVYVHDAGIAFLGDLVWEDGGSLTTPITLDSYDLAMLRESIQKLAERTGPFEVAAMGHGTPIASGGSEALQALAAEL
jgi:glyoxylase-like metal-dependent hydrolase (beta-lactamase superfamily II)